MKYAVIENGKVVNIVLSDSQDFENWVLADETTRINGTWDGQSFEPFVPDVSEVAEKVRFTRDNLLKNSDWTQIADAPVDKAAWATYRQALRDLPKEAGFPWTITWPTEP